MSEIEGVQLPVTVEFADDYGYSYTLGRRYSGQVRVNVAGHTVLRLDHSFTTTDGDDAETVHREVAERVTQWVDRVESMMAAREAEDEQRWMGL